MDLLLAEAVPGVRQYAGGDRHRGDRGRPTTLTFKVVDAAQREATLWTGSRLVANHPPVNVQLPAFRDDATLANPLIGMPIVALSDGTWTGPNLNVSRSWVQCDGHVDAAVLRRHPGSHRAELHADG